MTSVTTPARAALFTASTRSKPPRMFGHQQRQNSLQDPAERGYFPVALNDTYQDIRSEMLSTMGALGVPIEKHHHEVAGAGQHELGMKFAQLIQAADNVMTQVRRAQRRQEVRQDGPMPKPVFNDNGTGMHVHQSLWKGGQPLFFGAPHLQTAAGTSAASCATPLPSLPSPIRPPTATSAWCLIRSTCEPGGFRGQLLSRGADSTDRPCPKAKPLSSAPAMPSPTHTWPSAR